MSHSSETQKRIESSAGYEKRDVNVVWALTITAIIVVGIVLSIAFVDDIFVATKEEMIQEYQMVPENTILRDLQARETETLTTYKLLDAKKGIYRIPIEQAMQIVAEESYTSHQATRAIP